MFPAVRAGILPAVTRAVAAGMHRPSTLDLGASRTTEALRSRGLPLSPIVDAISLNRNLLPSTLTSSETGISVARSIGELKPGTFFRVQLLDKKTIWLRAPEFYEYSTLRAVKCCMPKDTIIFTSHSYDVTAPQRNNGVYESTYPPELVDFYRSKDIIFSDRLGSLVYPAPLASLEPCATVKIVVNLRLSLPTLGIEIDFSMPQIRTLPFSIKQIIEFVIAKRGIIL